MLYLHEMKKVSVIKMLISHSQSKIKYILTKIQLEFYGTSRADEKTYLQG